MRKRNSPAVFIFSFVSLFILLYAPLWITAQNSKDSLVKVMDQSLAERDGQTDFDFEIGTWKTQLKRLTNPLTGMAEHWVEYQGITTVRKVWNGKANLVELVADGPEGHFEGLNLRLYNPRSHQWSLNFASVTGGSLSQPTIGGFKNGIGEFYDQEDFNGRMIFVRFIIVPINKDSIRFEQAFSNNGGKSWEVNWIAYDTRIKDTGRKEE